MGPVFSNTNRALGSGRRESLAAVYNEIFDFTFPRTRLVSVWVCVWHPALAPTLAGRQSGRRSRRGLRPDYCRLLCHGNNEYINSAIGLAGSRGHHDLLQRPHRGSPHPRHLSRLDLGGRGRGGLGFSRQPIRPLGAGCLCDRAREGRRLVRRQNVEGVGDSDRHRSPLFDRLDWCWIAHPFGSSLRPPCTRSS